jgi:hypothetical protein
VKHTASVRFWTLYEALPKPVRAVADKNFQLLKSDPKHPSLHFKRIGKLWSVRVGEHHRALGHDSVDVAMGSDDRREIEELYSRLEREIDSLSPGHREKVMSLLRDSFEWEGDHFTPDDERTMSSFSDGSISIRQLQDHFGERLTNVLLRGKENGDV